MRISESPAAFVLKRATGTESPVVFDSPHSGIDYPADFQPSASPEEIRTTWDAYVDELCGGVTAAGATLLAARFPRAYIDLNRAPDDIDPEILDAPWPRPVTLSEHSRRGMGLIRRLALPGVPMYDRRLSVEAVERRLRDYYRPYRQALAEVIDALWRQHGEVWHFNCHSMKSRGNAMNRDAGALRPDFVIGDREGTTSRAELTAWVGEFFYRRGYSVAINDPYRGADLVRTHGDPGRQRYSLQIEINRALYLDEASCTRGPGFDRVRETMDAFAGAVTALIRERRFRKATP